MCFKIVGEDAQESDDESVLSRGLWREIPELSASMIVDKSSDRGIPGDGVLSIGAR